MNWRSVKASFRKSAALILAGVALVCIVQAQDLQPLPSKDHPLLEVDLRRFGYDTSSATRRLHKFADFTDSRHIALAWLTLDDPTVAEKIGPLTAKAAHLHVLVLDATTGQKQGLQEWSTPSTPVRFLGGRDGKFLTCTGNILRLFSPSFVVTREQYLASESACLNLVPGNARWGISPSRRSLLVSYPSGQGYQNTFLDVENLAVVATWNEKLRIEEISDHWLLATCGQGRQACIRAVDKPWHLFSPAGVDEKMRDFWLYSTRFVNDDILVTGRNKISVTTVGATQKFQVELPKNRSFGAAVTSTGGERFAVIENRQRGLTSAPLDMYAFASNDRAVVYSITDRRAIYAVKVKGTSPWTPWEDHVNQLALSADGTLLAVIDDGTLRVYQLPDANAAQQ